MGGFWTSEPKYESCSFRTNGTFVSFWDSKLFLMKIKFVWTIGSVGVQWIFLERCPVRRYFSYMKLGKKNWIYMFSSPSQNENWTSKIIAPKWKYKNWFFFAEFWKLEFPIRFTRSNMTIINSVGDPIINNIFEISKHYFLFPGLFYMP